MRKEKVNPVRSSAKSNSRKAELDKLVSEFASDLKAIGRTKEEDRKATLCDCRVNGYRVEEISPFMDKLTKIGFNVPLEFGGFKSMNDLVNHILVCTADEYNNIFYCASEMVRCYR